jgi:hypothetical protein
MKRRFLQLVCDFYISGRAGQLNEYLIGREVFERDDNYNPAADPIVRVGAHDVRKKLEIYYDTEGAEDQIRLEIPVGSYEPVFVRRTSSGESERAASGPAGEVATATPKARAGARSAILLRVAAVVLLVSTVVLVVMNIGLRRQVNQANELKSGSAHGPVWEAFFGSNEQTLLVVSNPPVYRFLNNADPEPVLKNSLGLNDEQANDLANTLKDRFLIKQKRELRLVLSPDDYTGMGEAIGLYRITDLFRSTGRTTLLKQSRTASAEDLKNHNVILLGSVWANEWSGKLPVKEDFVYTGNATIENRRVQAGEQSEYRAEFDPVTGDLVAEYALVTVKPNISFEDTVMVLAGIHSEGTQAAAEYVTSKNYLNELNQRLIQAGGEAGPLKYYQALLRVGVENSIPTTMSLVTLHALLIQQD